MKNKKYHTIGTIQKYHTIGTIQKSNIKIEERGKISKSEKEVKYQNRRKR
jgi:hypothetical protein